MTNKFIATSTYNGTTVAGLSDVVGDTSSSHFSFTIYVNEEEFCKALDELLDNYFSDEMYYVLDDKSIWALNPSNATRMVRDCGSIHITRGNFKVMYSGIPGALIGLTDVIRKAVKDRDDKHDKEN